MNQESPESDIIFYQPEDGRTRIDVRLQDETVWMSQADIAELYQTTIPNINIHIKSIFEEAELDQTATIKDYLIVRTEGSREVKRTVKHYNLEAIIAVGYRVRSHRGTQFRRWATERLSEYLVKGFTMDDERLKEGRNLGADYFDELLERIRDIRASEKRFYKKITDIYSTAIDYDSNSNPAREFFATVQNKLHWAIHGHTAAELIAERADADTPNMGLNTWKGDKVRKPDVSIAKNYLSQDELSGLNRIVTMYLDYAEDQAERREPVHMRDWADKLDTFLQFNNRAVLDTAGKVSADVAKKLAENHYKTYTAKRITEQDQRPDEFDQVVKRVQKESKE